MKNKKVHIIPHTHWDREWYFNSSRSTVYLTKQYKDVLDHLESNIEFTSFLMDAQSSLVEDYLSFYPEDKSRIKKLVEAGRLFVGPWYTQTDQLVISQESIVRNLLYGSKISNELGGYFNIAYAPDIFGQASNMPQIYKEFGMNRFLFWRGVSDNTLKETEFVWKGSDGTEILSKQIREGYSNCGHLPEDEKEIEKYLDRKMGDLERNSISKNLYFSNGFDQAPIRKNLVELCKKYNKIDKEREYVLSSPVLYFDDLEKELLNKKLNRLEGELTEAKHSRIHKSIFSSRPDLKQLNNDNERYIVNVLEPLLCISSELGNRYPNKELEKIWKLMFENAAHDSIGNCNSDTTNKDVEFRHKIVKDYAYNLADLNMRLISNRIKSDKEYQFTFFNTYSQKRSSVVEFEVYISDENFEIKDYEGNIYDYVILNKIDQTDYVLNQQMKLNLSKETYTPKKVFKCKMLIYIPNLPALGYKSLYLDLNSKEKQKTQELSNDSYIENEHYFIKINRNNSLDITDKFTKIEYKDQMIFEENGDDGDSYNYSPPRKDLVQNSKDFKIIKLEKKTSTVNQELYIHFECDLPYDLENRKKGIKGNKYYFTVKVELRKNENIIRYLCEFENNVLSHRFTVLFNTNIASKFSIADQVFGSIKRPTYLETIEVWEEEKWDEIPNCIEPMQSFVGLEDEKKFISVITKGVREYEIIGEKFDTIRLTLFRTYGYMGKENLLYRPGRASGETIVETPDAQLLKTIRVEFAQNISNASFEDSKIEKISKEYLTPVQSYQLSDFLNGRMIFVHRDEEKILNTEYSWLEFMGDYEISCIKKSIYSGKNIIRVYNPKFNKKIALDIEGKHIKLDEINYKEEINELLPQKFITIEF